MEFIVQTVQVTFLPITGLKFENVITVLTISREDNTRMKYIQDKQTG